MESAIPSMSSSFSFLNSIVASEDPSSNLLYLHHGDSPGSLMVTQPLNGDNYSAWSRSMIMTLTAKNKIAFIDGSLSQPSVDDPIFRNWTRCNNMVLSWIMNSVTEVIASSILYITNAEIMWKDLKERFSQGNGTRIFELKKTISDLNQ
jgi:hypothetical protein